MSKIKKIKIDEDYYKRSPNGIFLIKIGEDDKIYIRKDSINEVIESNPRFFDFLTVKVPYILSFEENLYIRFNINTHGKNTITLISDNDDTRNDCLVYAEKLCILNKTNNNFKKYREFTGKGAKAAFREKNTGLQIGWNDANNFKVVLSQISNKSYYCSINPDIGEAYLLSRVLYNHKFNYDLLSVTEKTGCPYHTAAVIFKDGENCNITLEADFSDKERTMPVFDMYYAGSNPSLFDDTFYMKFRDLYTIKYNPRFKLPSLLEKHKKSLESSTPREGKDFQPVLLHLYIDVNALRDSIRRTSSRISEKCTQCKTTVKSKKEYLSSNLRANSEPIPINRKINIKELKRAYSAGKKNKTMKNKLVNK